MQGMLQTTVLPLLRYAFAVAEAREGYNCLIGFSFTINYLYWLLLAHFYTFPSFDDVKFDPKNPFRILLFPQGALCSQYKMFPRGYYSCHALLYCNIVYLIHISARELAAPEPTL